MTRLSVGLLSSASYLPCPFRKDPRTLKRGSLGTGGRRVATKPTPSPSASSNWAVVYRSFLPFHFFLSLSFFCLSSSLFSRFFHFSLSLSLIFHLASTAIHLRRVLPEILFSQPLFNGQPLAFFSLSFSLSSLSLSPRQRFRLFSRGFLLSSIRALPSARQPLPLRHLDWFMGNVATWFVVVTAIVGDRAVPSCRHFCFLEYLWKKYSLEILKRGWRRVNVSSLFLSLFFSRVRDNEWSDELMIYREGISHILGDCSRMTWHRFELLCL